MTARPPLSAADGRYTTLGRHSHPNDDELRAARAALDDLRLAGWHALAEGDYLSVVDSLHLLRIARVTSSEGS